MEHIESTPISVRPHVGVRRMGKDLCLLNLKRREAWICGGSSLMIWQRLRNGATPAEVADSLIAKYNVPAEKVKNDVPSYVGLRALCGNERVQTRRAHGSTRVRSVLADDGRSSL